MMNYEEDEPVRFRYVKRNWTGRKVVDEDNFDNDCRDGEEGW